MRLFPVRFTSSNGANIQKLLDYYSQYNPTPMSIKQFIDFGKFPIEKFIYLSIDLIIFKKKNKKIFGNMRYAFRSF